MVGLIKLLENKKGMELSLNTIVLLLIGVIVLVIVAYYFITNYSGNSEQIIRVGGDALESINN